MHNPHPALIAATVLAALAIAPLSHATATEAEAQLTRGRYLVERVGMCADCHSPRNEHGEYIKERWLTGSALSFTPTVPIPWAPASPPIAGLPTMSDAQASHFLQTGIRPDGSRPRPPMPEFRFDAQDANAVVAYLRSLKK